MKGHTKLSPWGSSGQPFHHRPARSSLYRRRPQAKRNGGEFDFIFGKSVQKGAAFAGEEFALPVTPLISCFLIWQPVTPCRPVT